MGATGEGKRTTSHLAARVLEPASGFLKDIFQWTTDGHISAEWFSPGWDSITTSVCHIKGSPMGVNPYK